MFTAASFPLVRTDLRGLRDSQKICFPHLSWSKRCHPKSFQLSPRARTGSGLHSLPLRSVFFKYVVLSIITLSDKRANSMGSISDGVSDAHTYSHWSGSTSQQPLTSPTFNSNGPVSKTATPKSAPALRDYEGVERQVLAQAKETLAVTAFSSGLFFFHRASQNFEVFKMMSLDIFTITTEQLGCRMSSDVHEYCCRTYILTFRRPCVGQ